MLVIFKNQYKIVFDRDFGAVTLTGYSELRKTRTSFQKNM